MAINTTNPGRFKIDYSSSSIDFNQYDEYMTYAKITGSATTGGTTFYSWTAMRPSRQGGLELYPEFGSGTINPVRNPAVALNQGYTLPTGVEVLLRQRSLHSEYNSIWDVVFGKTPTKNSIGLIPSEGESDLCYWFRETIYPYEQSVPTKGPHGGSDIIPVSKFWFHPKVIGPYGVYYLNGNPWNPNIIGPVQGYPFFAPYTAFGNTLSVSIPGLPVVVYNSVPNLTPPNLITTGWNEIVPEPRINSLLNPVNVLTNNFVLQHISFFVANVPWYFKQTLDLLGVTTANDDMLPCKTRGKATAVLLDPLDIYMEDNVPQDVRGKTYAIVSVCKRRQLINTGWSRAEIDVKYPGLSVAEPLWPGINRADLIPNGGPGRTVGIRSGVGPFYDSSSYCYPAYSYPVDFTVWQLIQLGPTTAANIGAVA